MSLSIVPAAFLVLIIIFSYPTKDKESIAPPKKTSQSAAPFGIDYKPDANDAHRIYAYITSTFKRVTKDDAKLIAEKLVAYGKKNNIDPKFAAAVIAKESAFKKEAISSSGAKGLGQIKAVNYQSLKIEDPFNIEQNINGTTQYLRQMIKKWKAMPESAKTYRPEPQTPSSKDNKKKKYDDVSLGLASYFKGFTAVKRTGVDTVTQTYIDDIMSYYQDILKQRKKKEK